MNQLMESFGILPACCAFIISSNGTPSVTIVVVQDDARFVRGCRVDLDKKGRTFTFLVRVLVGAIAPVHKSTSQSGARLIDALNSTSPCARLLRRRPRTRDEHRHRTSGSQSSRGPSSPWRPAPRVHGLVRRATTLRSGRIHRVFVALRPAALCRCSSCCRQR